MSDEVKQMYNVIVSSKREGISSGPNCGIDLYYTSDTTVPAGAKGFMIDLGIKFMFNTGRGLLVYPRSSTGKNTPLRMSNSVGIIDTCYTGNIKVCVDNVSDNDYTVRAGTSNFQVVHPFLEQLDMFIVSTEQFRHYEEELLSDGMLRGTGGFGSTGKTESKSISN